MRIKSVLDTTLQERLEAQGIEKFLDSLGEEKLKQKKTRMENLICIFSLPIIPLQE